MSTGLIVAVWFLSFALCTWLEGPKLACVRKHAGWPMVGLLLLSGLLVAPVLLGQLLMDRLFARAVSKTEKL